MYLHRKTWSGERSGLRGGQGISPPLPIQASGNLSFKTSVTKQLKWGGAPSCIKIILLTVSCSKVSICGNTYCSSKIEIDNPSNGFLTKEEGTSNTIVQEPTPDVHFSWTSNILVNLIRLLCSQMRQLCRLTHPFTLKETVTRDMIQKTWQETEFRSDVSRATNGVHIEMY